MPVHVRTSVMFIYKTRARSRIITFAIQIGYNVFFFYATINIVLLVCTRANALTGTAPTPFPTIVAEIVSRTSISLSVRPHKTIACRRELRVARASFLRIIVTCTSKYYLSRWQCVSLSGNDLRIAHRHQNRICVAECTITFLESEQNDETIRFKTFQLKVCKTFSTGLLSGCS